MILDLEPRKGIDSWDGLKKWIQGMDAKNGMDARDKLIEWFKWWIQRMDPSDGSWMDLIDWFKGLITEMYGGWFKNWI